MRNTRKIAAGFVVVAVFCTGWAGFAQVQDKQVQDKSKGKSGATTKPAPAAPKTATDPAKKPAEPGTSAPAPAASKTANKPAANKPAADVESADEAAIRKGAADFVTAYNAHDAKAVSELFALKAEFTDEDGKLIKGREAIKKDFAHMFTEHSECKIEVDVDSIRVLTPNVAVEEGLVRGQPEPDEEENVSRYVAVHVKVEGKWLIASVSDYEAEAEDLTPHDHLQELAWMVGDWIDESPDAVVKSTCRWDESGNYLVHEFAVQVAGMNGASGSMRIGWDPLTRQLKSWTFDADSGHSEGLWTKSGDDKWIVKTQGVDEEGQVTSATNVYRYVDDDTMTWRSYDRFIAGEPGSDVVEFVIKRQAPEPADQEMSQNKTSR